MSQGFAARLFLYALPIGLYLAVIIVINYHVGEIMPLDQVVRLQANDEPVLYGPAFVENEYAYKLISAQYRHPRVLLLGSSRSMTFRSEFFNKDRSAFYNAAGAGRGFIQMNGFLSALDERSAPEVLMVEISQAWFAGGQLAIPEGGRLVRFDELLNVGQHSLYALINGEIPIAYVEKRKEPIHGRRALGFLAATRGSGFRNDGSYQFGTWMLRNWPTDVRMNEYVQQLQRGSGHFLPADTLNEAAPRDLDILLQQCQERHIFVIGYLPAYAPRLYEGMISSGKYGYLQQLDTTVGTLFEQYGFAYFNFSNAAWFGATDDDMWDGIHSSDYVAMLEYMEMLKALPDVLGQYSDLEYLEQIAREATNRFDLFENY